MLSLFKSKFLIIFLIFLAVIGVVVGILYFNKPKFISTEDKVLIEESKAKVEFKRLEQKSKEVPDYVKKLNEELYGIKNDKSNDASKSKFPSTYEEQLGIKVSNKDEAKKLTTSVSDEGKNYFTYFDNLKQVYYGKDDSKPIDLKLNANTYINRIGWIDEDNIYINVGGSTAKSSGNDGPKFSYEDDGIRGTYVFNIPKETKTKIYTLLPDRGLYGCHTIKNTQGVNKLVFFDSKSVSIFNASGNLEKKIFEDLDGNFTADPVREKTNGKILLNGKFKGGDTTDKIISF